MMMDGSFPRTLPMCPPHFLSCDWGTSHFRLRLVETATLAMLAEISTKDGVAVLFGRSDACRQSKSFEEYFIERVQELLRNEEASPRCCIVSGMASSNIGWHELPYVSTPLTISPTTLETKTFGVMVPSFGPIQVRIISGIRAPEDIMRGEETELLGLLDLMPEMGAGNVCVVLPGTHSKHVHVCNGVLHRFTTFMTGELFDFLQRIPTLASSLEGGSDYCELEFEAGVNSVRHDGFHASLFKIRSRAVLKTQADLHGRSFLSGLLIGSELLEIPDSAQTYLCGSSPLSDRYAEAARLLKVSVQQLPPEYQLQSILHAHSKFLSLL